MDPNPQNQAEAERLLGVAEKLLGNRDLNSAREFAILAQETDALLEGTDQIVAVVDVLLASEKRVNNHHDWYSILQLDQQTRDLEDIKKQYRKLALLLHPDKNKFPFADQAFKLVADAWAVFSDLTKKTLYDKELNLFTKVDLSSGGKLPVRRGRPKKTTTESSGTRSTAFWTSCPYCFSLFEYPKVYEGCCIRCDNCKKAFEAVAMPSMPPLVQGQDAYYCGWGIFPMGYVNGDTAGGGKKGVEKAKSGFPHWMPPVFSGAELQGGEDVDADGSVPPGFAGGQQGSAGNGGARASNVVDVEVVGLGSRAKEATPASGGPRKRGRPRKNPLS